MIILFPGEGLGSSRKGIADPIMAGNVKKDNLGVGAVQPGEVTPEDDIYEQYKKRMMLGYRHRPNPLVNYPFYYELFCTDVLSYYISGFHVAAVFVFCFYRTILARLTTE